MTIEVRPATGGDVAALDALLRDCFPRAEEAQLVQQLCMDGDMVLMLVANDEDSGSLVGAVAFSRMMVQTGAKQVASVALAPLAVAAGHRGQGVGEALVQAGIAHLRDAGVHLCFALGDPDYYGRFGFDTDWAKGFRSPYAGEYFMALPLQDGAMPCGERGEAAHASAFAKLGEE